MCIHRIKEVYFNLQICILVSQNTVPIETSLNTFIRSYAQLTGTKFMCLEAGCGVCIVTIKGIHPVTKKLMIWATNSVRFKVLASFSSSLKVA